MNERSVLWWGRFDPEYARNRIIRQSLRDLGWTPRDFRPRFSVAGDLEARLRRAATPALVWVPCFRQRDVLAAARWARRRRIPLVFDPLISAYDKQVFERGVLKETSAAARRLLSWERRRFAQADLLLADTVLHAEFFHDVIGIPASRIRIVPVGAEEDLFHPAAASSIVKPYTEVLFYGSFVPLQGPQVIIEAARLTQGEPIRWHLVGNGPLHPAVRAVAEGLDNVFFEDWIRYADLPARIQRADILLGVFGPTPKGRRVIPNKVYQAMACGKPIITQTSAAYPTQLRDTEGSGISWVAAGDARGLASAVRALASQPDRVKHQGAAAYRSYRTFFSADVVRDAVDHALVPLTIPVNLGRAPSYARSRR